MERPSSNCVWVKCAMLATHICGTQHTRSHSRRESSIIWLMTWAKLSTAHAYYPQEHIIRMNSVERISCLSLEHIGLTFICQFSDSDLRLLHSSAVHTGQQSSLLMAPAHAAHETTVSHTIFHALLFVLTYIRFKYAHHLEVLSSSRMRAICRQIVKSRFMQISHRPIFCHVYGIDNATKAGKA